MKMKALLFALVFVVALVGGDAAIAAPAYSKGNISDNGRLGGEGLFATITIYYISGPGYLEVMKSWLGWGKWVQDTQHLTTEVSSPDGMIMTAWGEYHITATGRQYSPSGCEGTFDLYFNGIERAFYVYFTTTFLGTPEVHVERFSDKFKMSYINIGSSEVWVTIYISWVGDSSLPASVGDSLDALAGASVVEVD